MNCTCSTKERHFAGYEGLLRINGKIDFKGGNRKLWRVECFPCSLRTKEYGTKKEAAIAWINRIYADSYTHETTFHSQKIV